MIDRLRAAVCVLVCAGMVAANATPVGAAQESASQQQEQQRALLTIRINTILKSEVTVILRGTDVLVKRSDLVEAGLRGFKFNDEATPDNWISLASLAPGLTYRVDDTNLILDLSVSGEHFGEGTAINVQRHEVLHLTRPVRSVFANYAIGGSTRGGAIASMEAGSRIGAGVLDTTWSLASRETYQQNLTRWIVDEPSTSKRLIAGDFFIDTGDLGGAVSFAGFSSERYFGFNTGIVRSVLPGVTGTVDTPSIANIYINGTLYRQETLAPGQFNLQNLPVQNGASNMQVVVTDAFGRQQVFNKSFYASDALLSPGLTDFQYGIGVIRPSLGEAPVTGAGFAGRYAAGVTQNLTAGARVEFAGRIFSLGPIIALRLHQGVLGLGAAASEDAGTAGTAGLASYQYISPRFNLAASFRYQSPRYATLSVPAAFDRPVTTANLSFGIPVGPRTSLTLSLLNDHFRDAGSQNQLQFAQWRTLSSIATLEVTETFSTYAGTKHVGLATQINFTPRANESASFGATSNDGRPGVTANFDRAVGVQAPSLGYDVGVNASRDNVAMYGQAQYRWQYGDDLANVNFSNGSKDVLLNAAGGLVFIGGKMFATRPLSDSYALVDAGLPGVRVFANNVQIGRTNRSGFLIVPELESYFGNQITIDPADTPMNTRIEATAQNVVPMARTGAIVRFDLRPVRTVTGRLRIRAGNGSFAVPAYGIFELQLADKIVTSDIGDGGEFYFENVPAGQYHGKVRYRGGACAMTVTVPAGSAPFVKLGTLLCDEKGII